MDFSDPTSLSMIAGLKSGSNEAWRRLVEIYGPTVLSWLRRLGLRDSETADVAQDIFLAVFVSIHRFRRERPTDRFRDWLYTIVKRRYFDVCRRTSGAPRAEGGEFFSLDDYADPCVDDSSVFQPIDESDLLQRAMAAVQSEFEIRTWRAFYSTAVAEKAPAEVAAELGMSVGAVYVARTRVLQRMRRLLEGFDVIEESQPANAPQA